MTRLTRIAPLVGVAYAGLVIAALANGNTPDTTDSSAKVIAFYTKHHDAQRATVYLLALAAVCAVAFYGVLGTHLRSRGARTTTAVMFGGGVLLAAAMTVAAGLNLALTDHTSGLSPSAAQALNYLAGDGFAATLFAGVAVTMAAAGFAVLQTRALPVWLGWVALVSAVGSVTGVLSWPAFLLNGLWTLVVSILLFRRGVQATPPVEASTIELPGARESTETTQPHTATA